MYRASISRSIANRRPASVRWRVRRSYVNRRTSGARSSIVRALRWFALPVFPLDMRSLAAFLGLAVFFFSWWWGYTMEVRGAAIDAYPSRWLHSAAFLGLVWVGSASGSCLWASLLPWRWLRVAGAVLGTLVIAGLFFTSIGTGMWFEMYAFGNASPGPPPWLVEAGILVAMAGWLIALGVLVKRALMGLGWGTHRAWHALLRYRS